MRTLSRKARYGLRALYGLARDGGKGPVLIADLARNEHIPRKFLELILLELRNAGILHSKKGKGGGYSLARSSDSITLGEVIRVIDGPLAPVPCVAGKAEFPCEECTHDEICGTRLVMKDVRDAIATILDRTTLASVKGQMEQALREARRVVTYSI